MNTVGWAWRSFSRNSRRAVPLVATFALSIALAVVGLGIQAGVRGGLADVRTSLGGAVVLSPISPQRASGDPRPADGTPAVLTEELAVRLASLSYVIDVDLTMRTRATSPSLQPVLAGSSDAKPSQGKITMERPAGFWLVGNLQADRLGLASGGAAGLIAGRLYTAAEVKAREAVALVHEELAAANSLTIGGVFALVEPVTGRSAMFTVVGIYGQATANGTAASLAAGTGAMLFGDANTIYTPYSVVQDLRDRAGQLSSAVYYLDAARNVDLFRNGAIAEGLTMGEFQLWSSDTEFETLASPLTKLAGLGRGAVAAAVLAGGMAACVAAAAAGRGRRLEMSTLRALGASRAAVAAQLAVETAFAGLAGAGLGMPLGRAIGPALGNLLLARELASGALSTSIGRGILAGESSGLFQWAATAILTLPDKIRSQVGASELAVASLVGLALVLAAGVVAAHAGGEAAPADVLEAQR